MKTTLQVAREAAAVAGRQWMPIETAPRGKIVLLFAITDRQPDGTVSNWKMATGCLPFDLSNPQGWTWGGYLLNEWDHQPTHWQPLPPPPAEVGQP